MGTCWMVFACLHRPTFHLSPSCSVPLGGDIYGMDQSRILTFWHSVNGKHQQVGNNRSLMFIPLIFLCQVEDWRMVIFLSGHLLLQLQVLLGALTIPVINTFRPSSDKTWVLSLSWIFLKSSPTYESDSLIKQSVPLLWVYSYLLDPYSHGGERKFQQCMVVVWIYCCKCKKG